MPDFNFNGMTFEQLTQEQVNQFNGMMNREHGSVRVHFVYDDGYTVMHNDDEHLCTPWDCIFSDLLKQLLRNYAFDYVQSEITKYQRDQAMQKGMVEYLMEQLGDLGIDAELEEKPTE